MFETKDGGTREQFAGMQREKSVGKPRYDLCIAEGEVNHMLKRWAQLMGRGAEKYSDRNWEKASSKKEFNRFKEAAFRHFMQWFDGEMDEDHAAAVFFNISGAEFVKAKLQKRRKK